jgi:4-hydroxy-3-methylbut-2-enyl diphosphate reductase IspH
VPTLPVTGSGDLDAAWFAERRCVGLTAGASTPEATSEAVHARPPSLLAIAAG